jgi:hypothetical protein
MNLLLELPGEVPNIDQQTIYDECILDFRLSKRVIDHRLQRRTSHRRSKNENETLLYYTKQFKFEIIFTKA